MHTVDSHFLLLEPPILNKVVQVMPNSSYTSINVTIEFQPIGPSWNLANATAKLILEAVMQIEKSTLFIIVSIKS